MDPGGRITRFAYSSSGDLRQVIWPDDSSRHYEYDERHLMTASLDESGNRSTARYDSLGGLTSATLPDGSQRFARSAEYTDARGHRLSLQLDPLDKPLSSTDAIGRTEQFNQADPAISNPNMMFFVRNHRFRY